MDFKKKMSEYEESKTDIELDKKSKHKEGSIKEQGEDKKEIEKSFSSKTAKNIKDKIHDKLSKKDDESESEEKMEHGKPDLANIAKRLAKRKIEASK